jgi:hypothetical protein
VCGVILPTIEKYDRKYSNNPLRRNIDITLEEHTKIVLKFNQKLQHECNKSNYNYIDITKHIIDKNGLVKNKFKKSKYDHHLKEKETYKFWIEEIEKIIKYEV